MVKLRIAIISLLFFVALAQNSRAANLTFISDLISSSGISVVADHTITFTTANQIPAGGKIVITPEAGAFNIPAGMDHTDIDFLVAQTPGNYVNRNIGTTPTSSDDGIAITTGTSGNITININTATGISAGDQIKILAGNNAAFQTTGDRRITNPSAIGSYKIDIQTEDGVQIIGNARTFIAATELVTVTGSINEGPPVMFNGNPSGDFSHTVTAIELWMNTNETSNCRYSTVSGQNYSAMADTFTNTDDTLHRTVVSGLTSSSSYDYYVKCVDTGLNESASELHISFSIKTVPLTGTIPGPVGGPEGNGGPPIIVVDTGPSGSRYPLDKASLLFEGLAFPSSKVHILRDGVDLGSVQAGDLSKFSYSISDISRGIYTFGFYAIDPAGNKSNVSNATFSLLSNSGNQISNIRIPPTVKLVSNNLAPGLPLEVSGYSIGNSSVELVVYDRTNPLTVVSSKTISSDSSGKWSDSLDTKKLPNGNYRLKARSFTSVSDATAFTQNYPFGLGVGEPDEQISSGKADFNGDSKVNLIDFSILLFNWGSAGKGTASDLNGDGTVNLTDFSVLLFNWTG